MTTREMTFRTTLPSASGLYEVDHEPNDSHDNPRAWPTWYKGYAVGTIGWSTFIVVLNSTSYTTGLSQMEHQFGTTKPVATLGLTTYLLGWAAGSLVLAPISEIYGRRPTYIVCMVGFIILTLPCAIASSLLEVLLVRFFEALFGAATIALAPGSLSDIFSDEYRALAYSLWSIGPFNGPVFGPLIGQWIRDPISRLAMEQLDYYDWQWGGSRATRVSPRVILTYFTPSKSPATPDGDGRLPMAFPSRS